MPQIPFFWDIPIAIGLMLMLELLILRHNYKIFSPVALFLATFATIYVMPYFVHIYVEPHYRMARLSVGHFEIAYLNLRIFFYSWAAMTLLLMVVLKRKNQEPLIPDRRQVKTRLAWVAAAFLIALTLHLGVGVGFDPLKMLNRAFNPREYTYIKAGVGPIFLLYNALRIGVLLIAAGLIWNANKKLIPIIVFIIVSVFTIIGGSKQSFIQPLLILIVTWQMMTWQREGMFKKLTYLSFAGLMGVALVLLAFNIFNAGERELGLTGTAKRFHAYQREAYYLPLVLDEFAGSPKYLVEAIGDSFVAFVPRAIFPNKPYIGLWQRYFRDEFEPNTVYYHTSTFGCLSEAHMFFGRAGPIIYGIIWALICYMIYGFMIRTRSWMQAFVVAFFSAWIYLLMRTGFTGTNFMVMTLYIIIGLTCTYKLRNILYYYFGSQYESEQSRGGTV